MAKSYLSSIYRTAMPGQFKNNETGSKFASSINDEAKQIAFYLCKSLINLITPDLTHPYLTKLFQRKFSVGKIIHKNKVSYFKFYESDDYGSTVILVNNDQAIIQLER